MICLILIVSVKSPGGFYTISQLSYLLIFSPHFIKMVAGNPHGYEK